MGLVGELSGFLGRLGGLGGLLADLLDEFFGVLVGGAGGGRAGPLDRPDVDIGVRGLGEVVGVGFG
jgi:hypothetical protein